MANSVTDNQCANLCDCLLHPFQHDGGTSQQQRAMDELLGDGAKIDARKTADLLNYFSQLSRHINYYDAALVVSDWTPFFEQSAPFALASLIKYNSGQVKENFELYQLMFKKRSTSSGLQLAQLFTFYNTVKKINSWYLRIRGTDLPAERVFESVIKDKLQEPLWRLKILNSLAARWYCINQIDFSDFFGNDIWGLGPGGRFAKFAREEEESFVLNGSCDRLTELYTRTTQLFSALFEPIKILAAAAEMSLDQSILPLKEELKEKHPPHLGLLFAFLKLFALLQADLNSYTRKHLDFFYREVLKIKPAKAVPDQAYIVFEIQKELDKYLLAKGLLLKDGKDVNKEEVLFALDDEIVVNQAQVKEVRTLFINNQTILDPADPTLNATLIEGVYMAPDATKADGVEKDFQTDVKNYYTVGNKESKYLLPGLKIFKPYPNARLGFVLASPVLLLKGGTRTVTISLQCKVNEEICNELNSRNYPSPNNCCQPVAAAPTGEEVTFPPFLSVFSLDVDFYSMLNVVLNDEYYYVSQELIAAALKKGLNNDIADYLRAHLKTSNEVADAATAKPYTYCPTEEDHFDAIVDAADFESMIDVTVDVVKEFFPKRKPFRVYFSGEKKWIEPGSDFPITYSIAADPSNPLQFSFEIEAILGPDKDAVTFYNKDALLDELDTTLPLVRIELDDKFKRYIGIIPNDEAPKPCCLRRIPENDDFPFSLYHFFRNVKVIEKLGMDASKHDDETRIDVKVCGLRNFVVQNDESIMDVNGPIYPFGSRPDVPDFTLVNPVTAGTRNLVGPNFYIGSNEVLRKKWNDIFINITWKDKPNNFNEYYKAYYVDPNNHTKYGLDENGFQINLSVLENGTWKSEIDHAAPPAVTNIPTGSFNRLLFSNDSPPAICATSGAGQTIYLKNKFFVLDQAFNVKNVDLQRYDVSTFDGFIRINLQNQDFLHKDYAFVLARQMIAFGKLPNEHVEAAVYYDSTNPGGGPIVISTTAMLALVKNSGWVARNVLNDVNSVDSNAGTTAGNDIVMPESDAIRDTLRLPLNPVPPADPSQINTGDINLVDGADTLDKFLNDPSFGIINRLDNLKKYAAVIPNEPWTPVIQAMSIDYTATATINDIDLIHLYPFQNTFKHEEIELEPTLFPTICDEGNLFLGLEKLVPGNNLNILFQLAEATADSESGKENVRWLYLDNNIWKPLRNGFEVIEDGTEDLTTSGIIRFALPENMTNTNTVMPPGLHWIRASIPKNSRSISETTGIYAQAMKAVFTNTDANDKLRLSKPIGAGQIAKLNEADASVKKVSQPFDSFGGEVPEEQKMFYVRVSELLRHKGRTIQKFDYERIVLNAFPQIFKAKCISHSFGLNAHLYKNDFPYAPGYVIMAVVPDLFKLKAGNAFEPKVPVSLLEKIDAYVRCRASAFVRFRAMNPRYERVHISVRLKLVKGSDENYFREKTAEDIREFLAPWAVGEYHKIAFGQCLHRSDIVRFLELRQYVDFILDMNMRHEMEDVYALDKNGFPVQQTQVCPKTPRSILIAGNIEVCIEKAACPSWDQSRGTACDHLPIKVMDYCEDQKRL